MDLPIPPELVLGVPEDATAAIVEAVLRRRLTPPAWADLSGETLSARAAWLEWAADGLRGRSSPPPQGQGARCAGLLLLLEAGEPVTVFEQLCRAEQPGASAAPPSGRSATGRDRRLLIRCSCLAAAEALHRRRRYGEEDRLLQEGLRLLGDRGDGGAELQMLQERRRRLLPFRILQLVGRGPQDPQARRDGLALLGQLLDQRGGFGPAHDDTIAAEDFPAFLAQIRSLLPPEDWIAFCEGRLASRDERARLPLAEALVASGFRQRKPGRIERALALIETTATAEARRLVPHLHLLLGDVPKALAADPGQSLGILCSRCRQWLAGVGFNGSGGPACQADLEAWFEDREVLVWIERRRAASAMATPAMGASVMATAEASSRPAFAPTSAQQPPAYHAPAPPTRRPGGVRPLRRRWSFLLPWPVCLAAGVALALLVRHLAGTEGSVPAEPVATVRAPDPVGSSAGRSAHRGGAGEGHSRSSLPLTTLSPSPVQLQRLLQDWLDSKGRVLGGRTALLSPERLAVPTVVAALRQQRQDDQRAGLRQITLARVEQVRPLASGREARTVAATIRYADEVLTGDGRVVTRTPLVRLTNVYELCFAGGSWKLSDWHPLAAPTPLPMLSERLQEEVP